MRNCLLCVALLAFSSAPLVFASPATYHVTVDTTQLNGSTGSLDFNFEPGPLTTQAASVSILNFTTDGAPSGAASTAGDASGSLAASTLLLDNGTGFNDYFTAFQYGSNIAFDISLFGPALSTPNGTATSGSLFAFSLFSDAAGTVPTLTTNTTDGFGYTVAVNLNGSTTATSYLTAATQPPPAVTPEPSSLLLACTGMAALLMVFRKRITTSAA